MSARLRAALLLLAVSGCASAPLPEDPYERELAMNDRESFSCDMMSGLVMSADDNAACQARVAAKRQQAVAEEMQRRQAEAMREQTEAMTKAIGSSASPQTTPATAQWCTVVIDGGKATEACFAQRSECNVAWGDIKAAGKPASDCAEKLVAAPPPEPAPPSSGPWCLTVAIEGSTAPSCYTAQAECSAAFDYHRQSGTQVTPCEVSK